MSKKFALNLIYAARTAVTGGLCLAACQAFAVASTDTANLTVTATIANQCSVGDAELALGAITLVGTDGTMATPTGSSTVNVPWACTNGTSATLGFGNGNNYASSVRRMKSDIATSYLEYELRATDSSGVVIGSATVDLTGDGTDQTFTVWGGVVNSAANKAAKPATDYTDTVLMTITFTP